MNQAEITNAPEKTEYQKLLENLNDAAFAQKFYSEKLTEAQELIGAILAVCKGYDEPQNSDWAAQSLFRIFDMFMIRHDKFSASFFAEDLQHYLFTWTQAHDNAYAKWSANNTIRHDEPSPTAAIDSAGVEEIQKRQMELIEDSEVFANERK